VLVVLYHQDFVRPQVFQGGDWLGEVWGRDLHFIDFIKVRPRSAERVAVERMSNVAVFVFRSNDYSYNECVSNWKALLLNKVVVGKGMKLVIDDPTLTQPPTGYDSVSISGYHPMGVTDQELGSRGSGPWRCCELR